MSERHQSEHVVPRKPLARAGAHSRGAETCGGETKPAVRRRTIELRPKDEAHLDKIRDLLDVNETAAIRRSLELTATILEFIKEEGGDVIFRLAGADERIRLL